MGWNLGHIEKDRKLIGWVFYSRTLDELDPLILQEKEEVFKSYKKAKICRCLDNIEALVVIHFGEDTVDELISTNDMLYAVKVCLRHMVVTHGVQHEDLPDDKLFWRRTEWINNNDEEVMGIV